MSEPSKKQSFLTGTAWLALAAAVVKVIGALYKIPLNAIIGEQGFGYFNTAYEIYNVMLTLSVAGLPVAMSRMISQANALGHYNQVRRTYATARAIFLALGFLGSFLMVVFCRQLAQFQEQPDAWACILCLGPAMLLIGMMSTFRGFFQGQGNMLPTATSQMLEALVKLVVGMVAAIVVLKLTNSIPYAAAAAISGVTVSCVVSAIYLAGKHNKAKKDLPVTNEPVTSYGQTAKGLLSISIPIAIGSAGLSVLTLLETKVFMGNLLNLGYSQAAADSMKGIYDMAKTIFNLPIAFVTPITVSIIPAITAYLTKDDHGNARATEESAVRITGLICAPCAAGLAVLARPVTALLGGYTGESLDTATILMCLRGASIVFYAVIMVTNAMMQAHGHANLPVVNMLIGGSLKLLATFLLTRNPILGIVGAPIGALLGDFTIMALNLITMRRCIQAPPAVSRHLLRSVLSALAMGVVVLFIYQALDRFVTDSRLLLCAIPIAAGVAVYAVCVIKFKAITRADCLLLPKGEKIADLLHL